MQGDWVAAVATIVGAVIGIIGTLIVEYLRKERKAIRFIIDEPEDLAKALRSRGSTFELKVNNQLTQTLIAAGVTVQNTGNVIINDLSFDLSIPGQHSLAQAQPVSESPKLAGAIKIAEGVNPVAERVDEPYFAISVPFLNPGESFKVTTFYDGPPVKCDVNCRLPGVRVRIASEEDFQRAVGSIEELAKLSGKVTATGVGGVIAAMVAALIATIVGH